MYTLGAGMRVGSWDYPVQLYQVGCLAVSGS